MIMKQLPSNTFIISTVYCISLFSTAVDCDPLTDPPNGQVHLTSATFGETANYSCNTSYNLVGNSTRICEANGDWSGSAPVCSSMQLTVATINYIYYIVYKYVCLSIEVAK